MVDISCPYLNLFTDFMAWESCFKNCVAPVPKGNLGCSPSKHRHGLCEQSPKSLQVS